MKVDRVYTRNIVAAPRSSSVQHAAALMREFHVGALLVTEDPPESAKAIGVITDRDVVVQAVARGFDTRELVVEDLMTPTVGSVPEEADLHEALELMRAAGVRRLAVTGADGAVKGMLSMDDVIDGLAADLASLAGLVKSDVEREREETDVEDASAAYGLYAATAE